MDTDDLEEALERAGLTPYQTDAYLTLLDLGTAPAVEVARESSVPKSQVYDVLRDLEDEGFVETIERDRLHARPLEPVEVMRRFRSYSELFDDAATEIEERWKEPDRGDHKMSVVKNQSTVRDRIEDAIGDAEHSIELSLDPHQFNAVRPALQAAYESGVVIRVSLYAGPGSDGADAVDPAGAVTELRENYIPEPLVAIVDRTQTYFAPNERSHEPYGVIIEDSILSFIFHWYFQTCLWANTAQCYTDRDGPLPYVSIEEFVQDFVGLWRDGAEIRVEARGIDNSEREERTVRGRVSDVVYPYAGFETGKPSLEQLSGLSTLVLDCEDGVRTVGGWGAVFEDLEVYELTVTEVRLPTPDGDDATETVEFDDVPASGDVSST